MFNILRKLNYKNCNSFCRCDFTYDNSMDCNGCGVVVRKSKLMSNRNIGVCCYWCAHALGGTWYFICIKCNAEVEYETPISMERFSEWKVCEKCFEKEKGVKTY